ncbi:MAG: FAD-binding protein [Oscillospiraceae bacterium]|nr:FAD-binding protein [Oscillospiraceae bacterium]
MEHITIDNINIEIIRKNTVVVGSGAAGLNAADRLYYFGQRDIAIVTEGLLMGTSRNTGSDKQTYYKLNLSGSDADSVVAMAETLYNGGAMDGDIALCEAVLSAQCFYRLAEIGVPFPHNEYGEYVGYKTDHDPRSRATSAGPLTSKYMTEKILEQIKSKNIPIYDGYMVIKILVRDGACRGVLCLNLNTLNIKDKRYTVFYTTNVIYAVGGPAGLYARSVYPESQSGASGIAFEAGIMGKNLTEWQYGIASIKFRWNLSGTYQQVLPAYISTDLNGENPFEFLNEYFETDEQLLNAVFLKGYQWPFDPRKINNSGSSLIDVLVYNETENKKRRVFLDFRKNPSVLKDDFSNTGKECFEYLKKSGALFGTPIERLNQMNPAAVELYKNNKIDLYREPLEIAVCAQHNNGGLSGNMWWESNIKGFFPVGEVNGTHGVYRPGGSALNSGQCGGMRAAMFIAKNRTVPPDININTDDINIAEIIQKIDKITTGVVKNKSNVFETRKEIGELMSKNAAHIRNADDIEKSIEITKARYLNYWENVKIGNIAELPVALSNRDLLIAQYVYLTAMLDYIRHGGKSRGSYMIVSGHEDDNRFIKIHNKLQLKYIPCEDSDNMKEMIQEAFLADGEVKITWRKRRPIPDVLRWFENVWNDYNNYNN